MAESRIKLSEKQYQLEETDIKPNRSTAKALLFVGVVVLCNWIMNEIGVFRVPQIPMRVGSFITLLLLLISQTVAVDKKLRENRQGKYIIMTCTLLMTLCLTVLMSFHATLCLILPMLLAMQYKSRRLGWVTFIGSLIITLLSPIIGFITGAWDTEFLQMLLQLLGYESVRASAPIFGLSSTLVQIVLYVVLPRELMIAVTGIVMFIVIRNGKKALDDQIEIIRSNKRILGIQSGILDGLATIIESRDGGTGEHVTSTRKYVSIILEYLLDHGLYPETVTKDYAEFVTEAAILHDIGKISIPDSILNKPGKFTKDEFEVMKNHTILGRDMIDRIFSNTIDPKLTEILHDVVETHHEKWDGTGYPRGLRGEDIPLAGRIMAIADVFDALTSKRVYKEEYSVDKAYEILIAEAGTHFDKQLVDIFVSSRSEVERFAAIRGTSGTT